MDFRFIHTYSDASIGAETISKEISKIFPFCKLDVRPALRYDNRFELARISDLKQPFDRQPKQAELMMPLYDGFMLQRIFTEMIPAAEADHVHIIFTSILTCTFSEDDWRYHARAVICGTPSIVSTAGIIEAPAKPTEFYLAQVGDMADPDSLKKKFAGRFIDYGDDRMTAAATSYALQALFFFVTDGDPFCNDKDCTLYNAHWQEQLVHVIERGSFCNRHKRMVNKFNNNKRSGKESF